MSDEERLPDWADRWLEGNCGCGSRLAFVNCPGCRGHIVCATSGWDIDKCPTPTPKEIR